MRDKDKNISRLIYEKSMANVGKKRMYNEKFWKRQDDEKKHTAFAQNGMRIKKT